MKRLGLLSRFLTTSPFSVTTWKCSIMPFYAVARGNTPGVYATWPECQDQIAGFKGARYKKFSTMTEAKEFVQEHAANCPVVDRRSESEKEDTKKESSNGSEAKSESGGGRGGRAMSPTLQQMKKDMERLQKELSDLKTKFDQYVANNHGNHATSALSRGSHSSSSTAEKRKHSDDEDEETEEGTEKKKLATDDKTKFSTDSDGFMIVYTDGACQFNGRHGAQAGVGVFFGHDHPLNVSEPVRGKATNNMAEIQAATYAVELAQASGFKKVAVHTDSQFMINCMTSWLKGWKKKNWVKSDGEPVKNKDELIALDKACEGIAVKWVHVKGHDGHEGNEEADRLARQGAKLYKAESNKEEEDDK
ncbi:ribonuclease H1-like isoform X1 [Palaemon carinicauda]|uniref:ribonuclease H1-like isoform X1 n=1 Tax=Palaemon carinicauda TaxID=392227 RepID=UPI0035B628B9